MAKTIQKRSLQTRAKLVAAAQEEVAQAGYEALRVEHVVQKAGVAKGTFFTHFADKDALMDLLIGTKIDQHLDEIAELPAPSDLDDLIDVLMPLLRFMTCERYVFDVILRHSGSAAKEQIGPIAMTFGRHDAVVAGWLADGPFRKDVDPGLLAEGVQAFSVQAMALSFCALHNEVGLRDRLKPYLAAWLLPAA